MIRKLLILLTLSLTFGRFAAATAQELPLWLRHNVERNLDGPMLLKSSDLPFDPSAPFSWEQQQKQRRYVLQVRREKQAQKSLEPIKTTLRKPTVKTTFKLHGRGNTEGNWSPHPDRALDARAIRYPMPRSAAYGKHGKGTGKPSGR